MKHAQIVGVLLLLLTSMVIFTVPVVADCSPSDGTPGDDSIVCGSTTTIIGLIAGRDGNDTITVLPLAGDAGDDVYGDLSDKGTGNDSLVIDSVADNIYGDVDSTGIMGTIEQIAGNDTIKILDDGKVDEVFGDYHFRDFGIGTGTHLPIGGNDSIVIESGGSVAMNVYGDFVGDDDGVGSTAVFTGGGGDDTILISGTVGSTVRGDRVRGGGSTFADGGDDSIVVNPTGKTGFIYGDDAEDDGGHDTITFNGLVVGSIFGDYLVEDGTCCTNVAGDDSITGSGTVTGTIYGDYEATIGAGTESIAGYDTIHVLSTAFVDFIVGDHIDGDGGDDSIEVFASGTVVGNIYGDETVGTVGDGDGGDDTIVIHGSVGGHVHGDNVRGDGGDDTIIVGGTVGGNVIGDAIIGLTNLGGKDSIIISGTVGGTVSGDDEDFAGRSRRDTIDVKGSGYVGSVSGDLTKKAGSRDTIIIYGTVKNSVFGDNVNRAGGADSIEVKASGLVKKNVVGDLAKTITGGKDTIKIWGTVDKNVFGDNFRFSAKPDADGGDDTITIFNGALVKGDVVGDSAPDDGGDDSIIIAGTVNGDVIGDKVGDTGGVDTIRVAGTGHVKGDVVGDGAGTPANPANTGTQDVFSIAGTVDGTVYLDNVGGPTFPDAVGDVSAIDLAAGGNDIIFVAGQIGGDILSATGQDGDDIFVIQNGATVGGVMDAGAHVEGDSLVFDLSTKSKGEFGKLSDLFNELTIEEGGVSYRGNRYQWVNFEFLQYAIQLFQTRTVPLYCSGIYEKNAEGSACVEKNPEEVDAIMFHRNNPGYDGRLPGTEACAIYNYGSAMRVYEVVDGSEGELVTTISSDVFSHNIESNLMLARSASGNVNVYYLTSNEIQVECTDFTGKTQVRIIPDFRGTVNASFDKDA